MRQLYKCIFLPQNLWEYMEYIPHSLDLFNNIYKEHKEEIDNDKIIISFTFEDKLTTYTSKEYLVMFNYLNKYYNSNECSIAIANIVKNKEMEE